MPTCAIITCKNRSDKVNFKNSGITYHSFPKDGNIKEKWIEAAARGPNWFPPKSSSICSVHFEQKCFQLLKINKKLFPWAVPTLKIPIIQSTGTEILNDLAERDLNTETSSVPFSSQIVNVSGDPVTTADVPMAETPRKRKLRAEIEQCQNTIKKQRTRIKTLQKKTSRYQKKIAKLEDILMELKGKNLVTSDQANQLGDMGIKDLIKRYEEKLSSDQALKTKYSPALRAFACTLHFYSPKAYEYVRQKFHTCLPHSRTIKKWYESVDASPGFTKESFEAIKLKVQGTGYKLFGNLVMDEMSIRQRIEWDGKEMHGYVDICHNNTKGDHLPEAKQALVFMVTAINAPWKIPVAYFLVDGVTGEQRANLIRQCLELLNETGIEITSLTFDGCPANLSMAKELGCDFTPENLKTSFAHPTNGRHLYIFPDPCHMVKLVRNALEAYSEFLDGLNRKIEWRHVKELNALQEKEFFHLGNKLRRAHIYFKSQKMKVRLAAQLFSNSVADALNFCGLQNNEGTVTFLKIINDLFDVLNSRNMAQFDYKKPVCPLNKEKIFSLLDEAEEYLKNLKLFDGSLVVKSSRKTGFVGFLVCIKSLKAMYMQLVEREQVLLYLPVYKISQDHLELMFGQIRAHGGCNTNPTARQFKAIYKKLMVKSELRDVEQGNCTSLEKISILTCSSAVEKINLTIDLQQINSVEDGDEPSALVNAFEQALLDEEIDILVQSFSEFGSHAITYVSGFVAHALLKRIKCEICASVLITDNKNDDKFAFIKLKDKGGLKYPTGDVITICKRMEALIKKIVISDDKIKTTVKTVKNELMSKAMPQFIGLNLFQDINYHQFEQAPLDNHITLLIKAVMEKYVDTRLHYLTKNAAPKLSKRQVLNKYLHFTGQ